MRSAGIIPKRETLTRPSTLSGHELPKVRGVYSLARGCSEGCGTSASAPWLRLDARELRHLDLAVSPRTSLQNLPSVPSYFAKREIKTKLNQKKFGRPPYL